MKCNPDSKGCFAAIEMILHEVRFDKTDIPLPKLLEMIEDQIKMIRQIEGLSNGQA